MKVMNPVRNHKFMKRTIAQEVGLITHHKLLLVKKVFCF